MIGHGLLRRWREWLLVAGLVVFGADLASAQIVGTRRWQLQPFCNVVTLTVAQSGAVFRVDGTDDQCGAAGTPASAIGTASNSADGSVALGLTIVAVPGAAPTHVMVRLDAATLGGTWRDSDGNAGVPRVETDRRGTPGRRCLPPRSADLSGPDSAYRAAATTCACKAGDDVHRGVRFQQLERPGIGADRRGELSRTVLVESTRRPFAPERPTGDAHTGVSSAAVGFQTTASGRQLRGRPYDRERALQRGIRRHRWPRVHSPSAEAALRAVKQRGVGCRIPCRRASFAFITLRGPKAMHGRRRSYRQSRPSQPRRRRGGVLGIGNALGNAAVALGHSTPRGRLQRGVGTHADPQGGLAFGDMARSPTVFADETNSSCAAGIAYSAATAHGVLLPQARVDGCPCRMPTEGRLCDLDGNDVLARSRGCSRWNTRLGRGRRIGPTAQDSCGVRSQQIH